MLANMRIQNIVPTAHSWHDSLHAMEQELIMSAISPYANSAKKATNVSLAESLLNEAKALRINISQAAEAGVAKAVAAKRAELWLQENWAAIESSNAYVENHGLPLEKYRMF
jgi:antitoxin CcdA